MPNKPMRMCKKQVDGCPNLTNDSSGYCDSHKYLAKQSKDYDKRRGSAASRGHDTKWRTYRIDFLKRNPTCISCGEKATVVDHIIAHKGDKDLFWARFNHQAMCASCHSRKTVLEDGGFGNGQK
ncbi:HNH endonuclease [Neobacillus pocheonensis]|uniref:HNH endonuclease n=1 Tax=Neobacillus pocheonensis TaxID=363869 RepID=A0ABT0W8A3_9BACI|nr:HNH endonuclease [Neobacillus pocheonensis]